MKKRKFRLLSKVVFFYLLITLVSFITSALILQQEANKHMHNILENRFENRERYIKRILKNNPERLSRISHSSAIEVNSIPESYPFYRDTLIMNEETQRKNFFRKKITYLTIEGKHYRVEMSKDAEELYKFRDDIRDIIIPILAILVIVTVLGNYLLSGFLLEPFQRILNRMSLYNIGQSRGTGPIKTSTKELHKLNILFEKMKNRIENDYFQLKEYTENMSHELQTPLSIIQNKTESLLSENSLTSEQVRKVKVIHDEVQGLSKLGSALNLITKIENKEFQNVKTIHTAPIIKNHIEKIEDIAAMKELTIESSLDEDHSFSIDPRLLDILIRNLVKNALRYSHNKSVVRIQTEGDRFSISNKGDKLNFSEEEIFSRFKKGNEKQSVGLGLAIVKKICTVSHLQIHYHFEEGNHHFDIYPEKQ